MFGVMKIHLSDEVGYGVILWLEEAIASTLE